MADDLDAAIEWADELKIQLDQLGEENPKIQQAHDAWDRLQALIDKRDALDDKLQTARSEVLTTDEINDIIAQLEDMQGEIDALKDEVRDLCDEFSEDNFWALMDKFRRDKAKKLLEADQELKRLELMLSKLEKWLREVNGENDESNNFLIQALKDDIYSGDKTGNVVIGQSMADRFAANKDTTNKIRVDKDQMKKLIESMWAKLRDSEHADIDEVLKDGEEITTLIDKKMNELDALDTKVDETWYQFDLEYKRMLPTRATLEPEYVKLVESVDSYAVRDEWFRDLNSKLKDHPDYQLKQKLVEENEAKYASWSEKLNSYNTTAEQSRAEIDALAQLPESSTFANLDVDAMKSIADRSQAALTNLQSANQDIDAMLNTTFNKERQIIGDADLYEITNDKGTKIEKMTTTETMMKKINEARELLSGDDKPDLRDQLLAEIDQIETDAQ